VVPCTGMGCSAVCQYLPDVVLVETVLAVVVLSVVPVVVVGVVVVVVVVTVLGVVVVPEERTERQRVVAFCRN
jgi:hypothetical protein